MTTLTPSPRRAFVVDRSRWRCGDQAHSSYGVSAGKGATYLLNSEGYMCCLGFACMQLFGSKDRQLRQTPSPSRIPRWSDKALLVGTDGEDTELTTRAIKINDSESMPLAEKEEKLIELFAKHNITLTFEGEYEL